MGFVPFSKQAANEIILDYVHIFKLSHPSMQEFPFVSKLDPEIYGPPESAITEEIINQEIRGVMTVKEVRYKQSASIVSKTSFLLIFGMR